MKAFLALLGAAGISAASLVLSSSSAAACTMIKADPKCWGDTCRMVCAPWGRSLGSAHPESNVGRAHIPVCGACVRGRKICFVEGSHIGKRVPC